MHNDIQTKKKEKDVSICPFHGVIIVVCEYGFAGGFIRGNSHESSRVVLNGHLIL
jgi:hypothetical protein